VRASGEHISDRNDSYHTVQSRRGRSKALKIKFQRAFAVTKCAASFSINTMNSMKLPSTFADGAKGPFCRYEDGPKSPSIAREDGSHTTSSPSPRSPLQHLRPATSIPFLSPDLGTAAVAKLPALDRHAVPQKSSQGINGPPQHKFYGLSPSPYSAPQQNFYRLNPNPYSTLQTEATRLRRLPSTKRKEPNRLPSNVISWTDDMSSPDRALYGMAYQESIDVKLASTLVEKAEPTPTKDVRDGNIAFQSGEPASVAASRIDNGENISSIFWSPDGRCPERNKPQEFPIVPGVSQPRHLIPSTEQSKSQESPTVLQLSQSRQSIPSTTQSSAADQESLGRVNKKPRTPLPSARPGVLNHVIEKASSKKQHIQFAAPSQPLLTESELDQIRPNVARLKAFMKADPDKEMSHTLTKRARLDTKEMGELTKLRGGS